MTEIINDRLIFIEGLWGSGKTTLSTLFALMQPKNNVVYANYEIKIPNFIDLKIEELEKIQFGKNLVILDEGYTWLEARTAGNSLNRYMSYKLFQTRKTDSRYVVTAQLMGSVDNRFRQLAGIIIKAKEITTGFKYKVYYVKEKHGVKTLKKMKTWVISKESAKKIFPYFNTYEIVMSDSIKNAIVKNMSRGSIIGLAKKLSKKLLTIKNIWSLRAIKSYLYENELSLEYANAIYYSIENIKLEKLKEEKKRNEMRKKQEKLKKEKINVYFCRNCGIKIKTNEILKDKEKICLKCSEIVNYIT